MTLPQSRYRQEQFHEFQAITLPVVDPDPELVSAWRAKYGRLGLTHIPDPYVLILFYHADRFDLLATGYWWLSPTPERPSIGFGSVAPRAVIWAHLCHRASGQSFLLFNTHIDHHCTGPMVALCRERFASFATASLPHLFIGDFNFNPTMPEYALLMQDSWQDAHTVLNVSEVATFLYDQPEQMPGGRIDHILYRGQGLISLTWSRLLSPDPERRVSDHDPVFVQFGVAG